MTIRTLYLPVMIVVAVSVACAVALLLAISEKEAQAAFPGKNGKIAYVGGGIYTINPGGGGTAKVTRKGNDPSYSPNSKRIAYSQWGRHDAEISTIDVGGGGRFNVTRNDKDDAEPSYSPDGKKIAYTGDKVFGTSEGENYSEIYTIKVGGGGKSQVTDTRGGRSLLPRPTTFLGSRP